MQAAVALPASGLLTTAVAHAEAEDSRWGKRLTIFSVKSAGSRAVA